jgi:hypothetical protein
MEMSGQIQAPAAVRLGIQTTGTFLEVGRSGRFRKENISCLCQKFNLDSEFLYIKETMICLREEERLGSSPYLP